MMKMLITILLTTFFLSSCRSVERRVICGEINIYQIKPVPMCDISFQFNRCRCRCFDYNQWTTISDINQCAQFNENLPFKKYDPPLVAINKILNGEITRVISVKDYPLEYCDGIAGSFLSDIAKDVRPNIKALNEVKNKLCN